MTKEGGAVVASGFGGGGGGSGLIFTDRNNLRRPNFDTLLHSESNRISTHHDENNYSSRRTSNASAGSSWRYDCSPSSSTGGDAYPSSEFMSPWNQASPWTRGSSPMLFDDGKNFPEFPEHGMIGSLVREEGHMYSLAASGDLLYTGSESKNIRVWKNLKEYSGFKSNSGLVKAIVISGDRIFTGHQDGKIRVWKFSPKNDRKPTYKRVGSLPTGKDFIKCSLNRKSYVEVRRRRNVPWIKHYDAVSSMSLDENQGLLYSASWDKTFKVWRISDSKCLESINAHDDALNSVAFAGFDGLVLTGSADGTVKIWKREFLGKTTKHVLAQTLLKQENAVTSLAVNAAAAVIYCGSSDGVLNFWQREKQLLSHGGLLRGHRLAVLCLATAGNLVFSGSADKSICVWRRSEGGDHACLSVFTGHCGPVKCLAVEEDQNSSKANPRWIAYSGSLDKSVKVWRVCENPNLKQFQIS